MSEVEFFSSGGGALALDVVDALADPLIATQIIAHRAADNVALRFAQNAQLKLPRILFEPESGAATTLKTKDALKRLANDYVTQAKAKELDALREALRGLRRFEVALDLAGPGFFGVTSIEGAQALSARVTVDLSRLPADRRFPRPAARASGSAP